MFLYRKSYILLRTLEVLLTSFFPLYSSYLFSKSKDADLLRNMANGGRGTHWPSPSSLSPGSKKGYSHGSGVLAQARVPSNGCDVVYPSESLLSSFFNPSYISDFFSSVIFNLLLHPLDVSLIRILGVNFFSGGLSKNGLIFALLLKFSSVGYTITGCHMFS